MSKLFWCSTLPVVALITIFIGYATAQSQMGKLREFEEAEARAKARETTVNGNGTINYVIRKEYTPYYEEVIK